ncbi:dienelactone hydrolase family protein [Xylophilus rhododendri]|uniref:dienelactone hydrolase family protein n=1 Tax=Xylophilus rhododendri TaxID=2697032 RepID=UPI001E29A2C6|nr:CocE/NonD family hydrolase [Xylophilus rhododendri]
MALLPCAIAPAFGAAALPEEVTVVAKGSGLFNIELETTVYRPEGPGPFPIVVINHGKAPGNPRFQGRYRPAIAARFFLARGYAVVVPMRQGFSKSSGSYIVGGCNVEGNGREQANDVVAALDWATAQPWADKSRILVVGQSHGGWTTLAFGTRGYPGVKGLVDFAGGLRQENCTSWQQGLISGAGNYGAQTTVPSLWFYGDNDSYWPTPTWKSMFEQYVAGGAKARMVAFGSFASDSHTMFGSPAGAPIWQPQVQAFLQEIGLPYEPQPAFAQYAADPAPVASGFAAIDETDRLPDASPAALEGYRVFLSHQNPRAFAFSAKGGWGSGWGRGDTRARALENCTKKAPEGACQLYAVDDEVVWAVKP